MALANEDSSEHETFLNILENRWQELQKQIQLCEDDLEKIKFIDELQELMTARNEYQTWLDSTSSSDSQTELQVQLISTNYY